MAALLDKMLKTGSLAGDSVILENSRYIVTDIDWPTPIPLLNFAFSGSTDRGFQPGLSIFAGKSKSFKTLYTLLCVRSFLDKEPEGVVLFYDNEFGTKDKYFSAMKIDRSRVIHVPFLTVEGLKKDLAQKLDVITDKDRVMIAIDSLGNVASKKEVEDAQEGKDTQDMTRAKQLKSLGRIITPHLNLRKIPAIGVNHTYMTQENYSREVMSGGTGLEYSSDTIFFISRSKSDTDDEYGDPDGVHFKLKVNKSRYVKENSVFDIFVSYKKGIQPTSGLFEILKEKEILTSAKKGWYQLEGHEGSFRRKEIEFNNEVLMPFWNDARVIQHLKDRYTIPEIE
jgi:RecA/RadA recombinase